MNYHERPEWSYSQMKHILDHGIDYAVAAKRKMLPEPQSQAIDLGQLIHMLILGGKDTFAVSEFDNFRTKAARDWRDEQIANHKNIVTKELFDIAETVIEERLEKHPLAQQFLYGNCKHEVEMYAKADGVDLRGKADVLKISGDSMIIVDIKTVSQFDECVPHEGYSPRKPYYMHYDLQAAVYTLIGSASQKISSSFTNYYFCFIETVAPYRVQFVHTSPEFLESGERKLRRCLDAIKEFGDKEPNFLIEEVPELGDFSL